MGQMRLNLRGVTTLLVDSDHFTRGLIAQMLRGFGMDAPTIYDSGKAAKAHMLHHYPDLCIFEAAFPDMDSSDLIRWIRRRQDKTPMRFVPIIVLSSYTQHRHVTRARDSGANLVLTKPVSPQSLFDHIAWVAKAPRPFIETASYMGPDRRFRTIEPPDGVRKRETDVIEIDDATRELAEQEQQSGEEPVRKKAAI
jgi:DNA-binding response OmpR family regulator